MLAIARPDVELVLIEPMERRTTWLLAETERLGLRNVTVLRARAEDAVEAGPFDQVTARAVSALTKLVPLTVPLLSPGGELLFLKGARIHEEITAARSVLRRHGIHEHEVLELGGDLLPRERCQSVQIILVQRDRDSSGAATSVGRFVSGF